MTAPRPEPIDALKARAEAWVVAKGAETTFDMVAASTVLDLIAASEERDALKIQLAEALESVAALTHNNAGLLAEAERLRLADCQNAEKEHENNVLRRERDEALSELQPIRAEREQMAAWLDQIKAPTHSATMTGAELSLFGRARAAVAELRYDLNFRNKRQAATDAALLAAINERKTLVAEVEGLRGCARGPKACDVEIATLERAKAAALSALHEADRLALAVRTRRAARVPIVGESSPGYVERYQIEGIALDGYAAARAKAGESFQARVHEWMLACFGPEITADRVERVQRFLEESIELAQALGGTAADAHALVDYVFGRPVGEPHQDVGGVLVTLAALCGAVGLDMDRAGADELARVWTKVEQIREKQRTKPHGSPLPQAPTPTCSTCNDTHRMWLSEREVPCTHCPTPCDACRVGQAAYCAKTPCPCRCHAEPRAGFPLVVPVFCASCGVQHPAGSACR